MTTPPNIFYEDEFRISSDVHESLVKQAIAAKPEALVFDSAELRLEFDPEQSIVLIVSLSVPAPLPNKQMVVDVGRIDKNGVFRTRSVGIFTAHQQEQVLACFAKALKSFIGD